MNEEEIKQKKMEALKSQAEERKKQEEAEAKLGQVVRALLTPEARARLNNVKLVNRELYLKAVQALFYMQRSGGTQGKIGEGQLKQLLEKMRSKRKISIKRK